jgi:hypothetical protein
MTENWDVVTIRCSTVVDHLTTKPEVKGLNPATCTPRERNGKSMMRWVSSNSTVGLLIQVA